MEDRRQHQHKVQDFLREQLGNLPWELTLPEGSGNETYFARWHEQAFFIKLGVEAARYQALAAIGLTPQVLAAGSLEDGTSILIQTGISGRRPSRRDYRILLGQFARGVRQLHDCAGLKELLPRASSSLYSTAGLEALARLQQKWDSHREQVPDFAVFVDASLAQLRQQIMDFQGSGLVASHNDLCNANWLLAEDGQLYVIDLESMTLDDPALDIGATLWWYYPPELRADFLSEAGYTNDPAFARRMQVRMTMHCLDITLPRPNSFDPFDPAEFASQLTDFRACLAGEQNPQGYAG